jgi:hypothetical protein
LINKINIRIYISFLHEYKTGISPSDKLLDDWSNLSQSEINIHLKRLYNSWGYNSNSIYELENKFISNSFTVVKKRKQIFNQQFTKDQVYILYLFILIILFIIFLNLVVLKQ